MRRTNADRMFDTHYDSVWEYNKNDSIRLNEDSGVISDYNTPIGKLITSEEYNEFVDEYPTFIILTMQDFKSQRTWQSHKLQITKSANDRGLPVIYVPEIDMGFGINKIDTCDLMITMENLLRIAKLHNTVTAGALLLNDMVYYTIGQHIDYEEYKPVDIFKYVIEPDMSDLAYLSIVEPNTREIMALRDIGVRHIYFVIPLKNLTQYHIELTNDIFNKTLTDSNGLPIVYKRIHDLKIEKWYKKKGED